MKKNYDNAPARRFPCSSPTHPWLVRDVVVSRRVCSHLVRMAKNVLVVHSWLRRPLGPVPERLFTSCILTYDILCNYRIWKSMELKISARLTFLADCHYCLHPTDDQFVRYYFRISVFKQLYITISARLFSPEVFVNF